MLFLSEVSSLRISARSVCLVSAYIGVLKHRQPQTFMQSCEDRRSLRQQRSYRPASDPEAVVSKPGGYAVLPASSTCSASGYRTL